MLLVSVIMFSIPSYKWELNQKMYLFQICPLIYEHICKL